MDERFGDWIRDTLADIDDEVLKRRWGAVESLADSLGDEEILDLLLYSTNCRTYDEPTLQKVRSTFWKHDSAFRMQGNDLELQRLCGAVLIHALHKEPQRRLNAALACICVHFGGVIGKSGWPVLLQEAETVLQSLSASVRPSDTIKYASRRNPISSKALNRLKQLRNEQHDYVPIDDLEALLVQFTKAINQLWSDQSSLHGALALQEEETDILWWLVGGYSNDLKQPFDNIDKAIAAVIAGKELADHIVHRPGPLSVGNILHRVLKGTEGGASAISLESLVPKLPMQWRNNVAAQGTDRALRYCPLLTAIRYCVSVEDNASWTTPFSKKFPHSTKFKISPEILAYQMYREWMLLFNLS